MFTQVLNLHGKRLIRKGRSNGQRLSTKVSHPSHKRGKLEETVSQRPK